MNMTPHYPVSHWNWHSAVERNTPPKNIGMKTGKKPVIYAAHGAALSTNRWTHMHHNPRFIPCLGTLFQPHCPVLDKIQGRRDRLDMHPRPVQPSPAYWPSAPSITEHNFAPRCPIHSTWKAMYHQQKAADFSILIQEISRNKRNL